MNERSKTDETEWRGVGEGGMMEGGWERNGGALLVLLSSDGKNAT